MVSDHAKRAFRIVEKIDMQGEEVDMYVKPVDEQIQVEVILNENPYCAVSLRPTDFFVDEDRIVAHPDFVDIGVHMETDKLFRNVVIDQFYAEEGAMGASDSQLHIRTE